MTSMPKRRMTSMPKRRMTSMPRHASPGAAIGSRCG
jgi:hypothetical protein